jgi:hypothetical protein
MSQTIEPPTGGLRPSVPAFEDGVEVIRANEEITRIVEEESSSSPPEYLPGDECAAMGPEYCLDNLRRQIAWLTSTRRGNLDWEKVASHSILEGVTALAYMAEEIGAGEEPPLALTQLSAELAVVIRTKHGDRTLPPQLGSEEPDNGPVRYPLLSWGGDAATSVSCHIRDALDTAAVNWGGAWLSFASSAVVEQMAEEDPGRLLGELAELGERTSRVVIDAKMSSNQLTILKAFFSE